MQYVFVPVGYPARLGRTTAVCANSFWPSYGHRLLSGTEDGAVAVFTHCQGRLFPFVISDEEREVEEKLPKGEEESRRLSSLWKRWFVPRQGVRRY